MPVSQARSKIRRNIPRFIDVVILAGRQRGIAQFRIEAYEAFRWRQSQLQGMPVLLDKGLIACVLQIPNQFRVVYFCESQQIHRWRNKR